MIFACSVKEHLTTNCCSLKYRGVRCYLEQTIPSDISDVCISIDICLALKTIPYRKFRIDFDPDGSASFDIIRSYEGNYIYNSSNGVKYDLNDPDSLDRLAVDVDFNVSVLYNDLHRLGCTKGSTYPYSNLTMPRHKSLHSKSLSGALACEYHEKRSELIADLKRNVFLRHGFHPQIII